MTIYNLYIFNRSDRCVVSIVTRNTVADLLLYPLALFVVSLCSLQGRRLPVQSSVPPGGEVEEAAARAAEADVGTALLDQGLRTATHTESVRQTAEREHS